MLWSIRNQVKKKPLFETDKRNWNVKIYTPLGNESTSFEEAIAIPQHDGEKQNSIFTLEAAWAKDWWYCIGKHFSCMSNKINVFKIIRSD